MSPEHLPCVKALDRECFRAHPEFARRAFAYRLLHLLIPSDIAKLLPKQLSDPLVAPGVTIPLGAEFPPGTVIVPGCDFPAGWDPEDEPPECAKSAPLPSLAMQVSGANPNVFLSPGEPGTGQVHPPAGPAPEEHGSGTYYAGANQDDARWAAGWLYSYTDSYLNFAWNGVRQYHMLINFNSIMAPQGSTIISAKMTLESASTRAGVPIDLKVYANDVDSPVLPTDSTEAEALVLTSANVDWSLGAWSIWTRYDSPDLINVIQEVVNRSGWAAGNNLMIITRSQATSNDYRSIYAYDGGLTARFASLYVEW